MGNRTLIRSEDLVFRQHHSFGTNSFFVKERPGLPLRKYSKPIFAALHFHTSDREKYLVLIVSDYALLKIRLHFLYFKLSRKNL